MTSPPGIGYDYDARIRRSEKLIAEKSSASELLSFYKRVLSFQKTFTGQIATADAHQQKSQAKPFPSLRDPLDLTLLLPHFRNFLSLVELNAPKALAATARELTAISSESWVMLLSSYWELAGRFDQQIGAFAQFLPRAFLQPYAAYIAARTAVPPVLLTPRICPLCGSRPLFGVLRREGDGGKRSMVCSFCGYEWDFRRILCTTCGEEDETKQPVYVAEQFPHIRVEVCETCKFFIRTVDLTTDGHAVPVVDDLAAIPLTLWAHEHGYTRLQPNMFGS